MKLFDQYLCNNLRYELNPRVRCAFGNVWISNNKTPCEGIERRKEFQLKHDKAGERKYSTDMFYIVQK